MRLFYQLTETFHLQMGDVMHVIEEENKLRTQSAIAGGKFSDEAVEETSEEIDALLLSEFEQLDPGKVRSVVLGGHYPAVVLDAKPNSGHHTYKAAIFLVPRVR